MNKETFDKIILQINSLKNEIQDYCHKQNSADNVLSDLILLNMQLIESRIDMLHKSGKEIAKEF